MISPLIHDALRPMATLWRRAALPALTDRSYVTVMSSAVIFAMGTIGCIPVMVPQHPGVSGEAVDARTQVPLSEVRVTLVRGRPSTQPAQRGNTAKEIVATTFRDGCFSIDAKSELQWTIVPLCVTASSYHVRFARDGYDSLTIPLEGEKMAWKTNVAQLGQVSLEPSTRPSER